MPRLSSALLLMTLVVGSSRAMFAPQSKGRVFGGKLIKEDPCQVQQFAVLMQIPGINCTGSIIHRWWVLTAGDCLEGLPPEQAPAISITAGAKVFNDSDPWNYKQFQFMQVRSGREFHVHPPVSIPGWRSHNAALVKANASWETGGSCVKAIRLVAGRLPARGWDSRKCQAAGFGYSGRPGNPRLRSLAVRVPPPGYCKQVISAPVFQELCLKLPSGQGPCYGDWGGPLACHNKMLLGVSLRSVHQEGSLAHPFDCARGDEIQLFTYTGAIMPWIRHHVPDLPEPVFFPAEELDTWKSGACRPHIVILPSVVAFTMNMVWVHLTLG